jgi:catechol 2,3-dioxygenase-like lactoylglutathione lyase family enzyme
MAPKLGSVIPVFRIFDEAKAREFYCDFLGFEVEFEHRYQEDFPIFMGIKHGDCRLYLSEHNGDGSPGASIRVRVEGIQEYQEGLLAKQYKYSRPGLEDNGFGDWDMSIGDPFGNRITFWEPKEPVPA